MFLATPGMVPYPILLGGIVGISEAAARILADEFTKDAGFVSEKKKAMPANENGSDNEKCYRNAHDKA